MDTRRESRAETAENPAAVADAESHAMQMITGLRERTAARVRAAGALPLGVATVAALALLGGWVIRRRRGRR
jgi:hypothetical protein